MVLGVAAEEEIEVVGPVGFILLLVFVVVLVGVFFCSSLLVLLAEGAERVHEALLVRHVLLARSHQHRYEHVDELERQLAIRHHDEHLGPREALVAILYVGVRLALLQLVVVRDYSTPRSVGIEKNTHYKKSMSMQLFVVDMEKTSPT